MGLVVSVGMGRKAPACLWSFAHELSLNWPSSLKYGGRVNPALVSVAVYSQAKQLEAADFPVLRDNICRPPYNMTEFHSNRAIRMPEMGGSTGR